MNWRGVTSLALTLVLTMSSYGGELEGGGGTQGQQESVMRRTVSTRTIAIRIHNYARVNPSILNQATKVASEIFRDAGVDPIWVECSTRVAHRRFRHQRQRRNHRSGLLSAKDFCPIPSVRIP